MSTLFVPWLVFPAVLGALSLGCGLLLERVSALRLPRTLVLPVGLAVVSLVAQLATMTGTSAVLAVPAVVAAAIAGLALSLPWRTRRVDLWPVAAAIGAFAAYAAPIVLSGQATFAGYIKLDDDSTLMALTDRVMEHGRSLDGLAPSTYLRTLDTLLDEGYPMATFMPLGIGSRLVGEDGLWLYQPAMAFMAAMLALSLYQVAARVVEPRWARAFAAFVAAQAALLYGYALWGGIKELGTAWALPLLATLLPPAVRADRLRHLIPLAAVSALLLGVLNLGALPWLAPALVFAVVAIFRAQGLQRTIRAGAAFTGFVALFALPTIAVARDFLSSNIVTFDPLANLLEPLNPLQVAGIWPAGDFRVDPRREGVTYAVIAIAVVAATAAVIWCVRRGIWEFAAFVVGAVGSASLLWAVSSPWIEGKAFATAAPAIPLAALAAGALLAQHGRLIEGGVLALVVAGGVLWSNVLQYRDAWLAPRSQLAELESIGSRFAGDGPALMTEYQPYGVRHFLRDLDPEGASELRVRPVPLRNGQLLGKGGYANIDEFQLDAILVYRTLVLRRSPLESRPPSQYKLAWSGDWYEVWQRPEAVATPLEHLSLGAGFQPGHVTACRQLLGLAQRAGAGGQLAAVERQPVLVADLSRGAFPPGWGVGQSADLVPAGEGTVEVSVDVRRAGTYRIWLGGAFRNRIDLSLDGRHVAGRRNQLDHFGQYTQLAQEELGPGVHRLTLRYGGPDLHPGSGGPQFSMGPLVLAQTTADLPVIRVPSAEARSLCGRNLDWAEALGG